MKPIPLKILIRVLDDMLQEVQGSKYRALNESDSIDQITAVIDRLKQKILEKTTEKHQMQQIENRKKEIEAERDRKRRDRVQKQSESERRRAQLHKKSADE